VQRLEDSHRVAFDDHVGGHRQAGRAAADHRDPPTRRRSLPRDRHRIGLAFKVGREAFEVADGHRLFFLAQQAGLLALVVLGTDASADRRKRVLLLDQPRSLDELAGLDKPDEARDVDLHRTSGDTRGLLTFKAAARLHQGQLAVQAVGDLAEIADTQQRVLFGLLLPRHPGLYLGLVGARHPVPMTAHLGANREIHEPRLRIDDETRRRGPALVAGALLHQRPVAVRTRQVVDHRPLAQLDVGLPLEDIELRTEQQLAFPPRGGYIQPQPYLSGDRVEDVERLMTMRTEGREFSSCEDALGLRLALVHRRAPTAPGSRSRARCARRARTSCCAG